ncbi:MAG TPA: gephyrin-like molybdotransferase Glp [Thermomicrobiaceae bacterium]|nr:gephyrin-like molybdotransferase Glp [Thermomicrobiaceae bacterium]
MPVGDRLIAPAEALDIILAQVRPLPVETVPLSVAGGRVLAVPFHADQDLPAFAAATMDGFAVVSGDVSPWREIVGDQYAGTVEDIEVTEGTAARIMTGAPLPPGADAVVRVENTELRDDHVIVHQELVFESENVRPIGADLRAGQLLVDAGEVIGPAEIGLLASLGHVDVPVYQRPRVSVLSTGDEVVDPSETPGPGQIRDSNRFSLELAARAAGADVIWSGHAPDDASALRALFQERIAASDALVTSGGVSMGERDLVKGLLAELGTVHFRRLFMKPGKPFNFATVGGTLVFGLPGNPVSALVGFEVFVTAALQTMAGRREPTARPVTVTLEHDVEPTDRLEYQRGVVWSDDHGVLHARNTGSQSSARLLSLVGSNAFVLIPPRAEPYRAGERVQAIVRGVVAGGPPRSGRAGDAD